MFKHQVQFFQINDVWQYPEYFVEGKDAPLPNGYVKSHVPPNGLNEQLTPYSINYEQYECKGTRLTQFDTIADNITAILKIL